MAGFLDIDVLHEPATRIFQNDENDKANGMLCHRITVRSFNRNIVEELELPLKEQSAEKSTVFLRGLFCSKCTLLIRSPFFYKCTKGCP